MDSLDIYDYVSLLKNKCQIIICNNHRFQYLQCKNTWYFICVKKHWILLKTSVYSKTEISEYFDSYGDSSIIADHLVHNICFTNNINIQGSEYGSCGYYCVLYIFLRLMFMFTPRECITVITLIKCIYCL